MSDVEVRETQFGFTFGAAHVERMFSHQGSVALWIGNASITEKGSSGIQVQVSRQGRSIRVFRDGIELKEARP